MLGEIYALGGMAVCSSEVININKTYFCTSWVIHIFALIFDKIYFGVWSLLS